MRLAGSRTPPVPFPALPASPLLAAFAIVLRGLAPLPYVFERGWGTSLLILVIVAALTLTWWLLRRVTRGFVDLPNEFADERILNRRGETFRLAYLGSCGLVAAVMVAAIAANVLDYSIPTDVSVAVLMAVFWISVTLPNAVFAWREPQL